MKKISLSVALSLLLFACNSGQKTSDSSGQPDTSEVNGEQAKTDDALLKLEGTLNSDTSFAQIARNAVAELAEKKIPSSACYSEPLRLSPSTYLDKSNRTIKDSLSAAGFFDDKKQYTWGQGNDKPISLSNIEYYQQYIFDKDYVHADTVAFNSFFGDGNTVNNIKKIYPNSYTADFHFKGTEKNGNMDWSTLRLVFKKVSGKYCLVAIVHNEWSI